MYPFFVNLKGRKCTVIGTGKVAQRRIKSLAENGADITTVSPEKLPDILKNIVSNHIFDCYKREYLDGSFIAMAATNSIELNSIIVADAQEKGILTSSATEVNGVISDLIVPATTTYSGITTAITTEGLSPGLSAAICREIVTLIKKYDGLCDIHSKIRSWLIENNVNPEVRRKILLKLSDDDMLEIYKNIGTEKYLETVREILENSIN